MGDDEFVKVSVQLGLVKCYRTPGGRYFLRRTAYEGKYGGLGGATEMRPQVFLSDLASNDPPLALRCLRSDPTRISIHCASAEDREVSKIERRARRRRSAFAEAWS